MVYSRMNPPTDIKEPAGSYQSKTERAGYIPAKEKIESLIMAGVRLDQYRKEAYDWAPGEDIDDKFFDPTRHPSFEMEDGHILREKSKSKLDAISRRQQIEADEKKAAKAAEEAAERSRIENKDN